MAEPQPSDVQEGAADPHATTSNAEDRKAAAALESLGAREDTGVKKEVDSKALDAAMKDLNVKDNKVKDKQAEEKKVVKIDAADVALLVAELEFTKQKASELLRAHDGDPVKAMKAFVAAAI